VIDVCTEDFLSQVKSIVPVDLTVEPCAGEAVVISKMVSLPNANGDRKRKVSGGVWAIVHPSFNRYGWTMHDRYGRGGRKFSNILAVETAVNSVVQRVQQEATHQLAQWEYDDQARIKYEQRKATLDTVLTALNGEGYQFVKTDQHEPTIQLEMVKHRDGYFDPKVTVRGKCQDDGTMRFMLWVYYHDGLYMTIEQMRSFVALLKSWGYVTAGQ
jgi:hypothetical protein